MQINRLFGIIYLLMEQKSMTSKELAAHFEVSVRTILRDVDTLSSAGIPVYTMQGKGGGISLMDGYVLSKTVISEDEQNQILFALQGLPATQHLGGENILGRLRSLFDKTDTRWIEVDFSRWGNTAADRAKFEQLKNAIIQRHALQITYAGSSGETAARKIYPLQLMFKSKAWYLNAFCLQRADYRVFKINRIRNLEVLPETFGHLSLPAPEAEPTGLGTPPLVEIKLKFSPQMAYRLYDEFDGQFLHQSEDGSYTLSMMMPEDASLYPYLLSFGAEAEVLEPPRIREGIVRELSKIKKQYAPIS